uniref:Putative bcl2/adenovirus e1b 19 kDa protein-interacting protein 3 n=1 Tax=Anopheles triannulatus TaxID=58253 RepID=A0A2M4A1R1_9DIPT
MFRTIGLSSDKKSSALASSSKSMAASPLMKMGTEELGESWIELSSNTTSQSAIGGLGSVGSIVYSGNSSNAIPSASSTTSTTVPSSSTSQLLVSLTPPELNVRSPERTTPLPFASVEEYMRLLREAQRESKESSRVTSLTSSRKNSPRGSPKSPPNSPNTELAATEEDLKNVYINYENKEGDIVKDTDWVWDWSSRPDQQPPKEWKFVHPKKAGQEECTKTSHAGYSIRQVRVGKNSLFSREFLYSIVLTNVLSLLLGAGIGAWLQKRGLLLTRISIE